MSELETGFRIGDVIAMIKRRWTIVVGASVLGLIAGYLVFASAPTTFSATARVQVMPVTLDQFATDARTAEVDIQTEKDLVKSDAVADAVPDLGDLRVKTSIDAFGEALPMACDETPIGRQINRRVEVWLRAPKDSPAPEN